MLLLEPSAADAEIEAAAGDVIERRRHLRGDARIAVGVAVDQRSDTSAGGVLAQRAQQGPSFKARPIRIGHKYREEVVEAPQRVVAPAVGLLPQLAHLLEL